MMRALPVETIRRLVEPYMDGLEAGDALLQQLSSYLDLLVKWNARTNLTAIRAPEEMVVRHFGESLFAGRQLAGRVAAGGRILDFGSGAGFPGLPIQLLLPEMRVTLAESQGKKASFLREAVRVLGLETEVWGGRVEEMAADRRFDVVTLRAVDRMEEAVVTARERVAGGGWMVRLTAGDAVDEGADVVTMPGSAAGRVVFERV